MKPRAWILTTLVLACGCVTTKQTAEAAKIRMTANADAVKGCKFLGNVKGSDHLNGGAMGQGFAEESATNEMLNHAAELGANTVLTVRSTTNTSGSNQLGEAYSCPTSPTP